MFSFPFTIISVDKIFFKHISVHNPINFPPNKTLFFGIMSVGKNSIEIKTIPRKKITEKKKLLIICT
jgi:hypothetical protein